MDKIGLKNINVSGTPIKGGGKPVVPQKTSAGNDSKSRILKDQLSLSLRFSGTTEKKKRADEKKASKEKAPEDSDGKSHLEQLKEDLEKSISRSDKSLFNFNDELEGAAFTNGGQSGAMPRTITLFDGSRSERTDSDKVKLDARSRLIEGKIESADVEGEGVARSPETPYAVGRYLDDMSVLPAQKRTMFEKTNGRGVKNIDTLMESFDDAFKKADGYARSGDPKDIVKSLGSKRPGGGPVRVADSDVSNVLHSLKTTKKLINSGVYSRSQLKKMAAEKGLKGMESALTSAQRLDRSIEMWSGAKRHFKVKMKPGKLRSEMKKFLARMPAGNKSKKYILDTKIDKKHTVRDFLKGETPESLKEGVEFYSSALDGEGKPLERVNHRAFVKVLSKSPDTYRKWNIKNGMSLMRRAARKRAKRVGRKRRKKHPGLAKRKNRASKSGKKRRLRKKTRRRAAGEVNSGDVNNDQAEEADENQTQQDESREEEATFATMGAIGGNSNTGDASSAGDSESTDNNESSSTDNAQALEETQSVLQQLKDHEAAIRAKVDAVKGKDSQSGSLSQFEQQLESTKMHIAETSQRLESGLPATSSAMSASMGIGGGVDLDGFDDFDPYEELGIDEFGDDFGDYEDYGDFYEDEFDFFDYQMEGLSGVNQNYGDYYDFEEYMDMDDYLLYWGIDDNYDFDSFLSLDDYLEPRDSDGDGVLDYDDYIADGYEWDWGDFY